MVQGPEDPSLLVEALREVSVSAELKGFDRDLLLQQAVGPLCQIHHTHAASAELPHQAIRTHLVGVEHRLLAPLVGAIQLRDHAEHQRPQEIFVTTFLVDQLLPFRFLQAGSCLSDRRGERGQQVVMGFSGAVDHGGLSM